MFPGHNFSFFSASSPRPLHGMMFFTSPIKKQHGSTSEPRTAALAAALPLLYTISNSTSTSTTMMIKSSGSTIAVVSLRSFLGMIVITITTLLAPTTSGTRNCSHRLNKRLFPPFSRPLFCGKPTLSIRHKTIPTHHRPQHSTPTAASFLALEKRTAGSHFQLPFQSLMRGVPFAFALLQHKQMRTNTILVATKYSSHSHWLQPTFPRFHSPWKAEMAGTISLLGMRYPRMLLSWSCLPPLDDTAQRLCIAL